MSDFENLGPGWKRLQKSAEYGPAGLIVRVLGFFLVLGFGLGAVGYVAGWFGEAARVAQAEFGAEASLAKYERFKDMAAQLTARKASIEVLSKDLETRRVDNGNRPKPEWLRDEREAFNQKESELQGLKLSYNNLAADYNSAMAKFNWAFAKRGNLPAGASDVLPGDGAFAPYSDR